MHQNSPFSVKNRKIVWGWGITAPSSGSPGEENTPSTHSNPLGAEVTRATATPCHGSYLILPLFNTQLGRSIAK